MKDTLDKINLWIDISEKEICKFQKKKKNQLEIIQNKIEKIEWYNDNDKKIDYQVKVT